MKVRDLNIGEAANRSCVSPKIIRFYEEAGMIKPAARGENRYRVHSEADVQTLSFIRCARRLGFRLKDISKLLELHRNDRRASRAVKKLALEHVAELDRKIVKMTAIRNAIEVLSKRCRGNDRPECPILDKLGSTERD